MVMSTTRAPVVQSAGRRKFHEFLRFLAAAWGALAGEPTTGTVIPWVRGVLGPESGGRPPDTRQPELQKSWNTLMTAGTAGTGFTVPLAAAKTRIMVALPLRSGGLFWINSS